MIKKIFNLNKKYSYKKGMTYVELIVTISIFFIMASIVLSRNDNFQKKVEIENLTNQIAQDIVQAQKDALAGKNAQSFIGTDPITNEPFRPAYGVYFSSAKEDRQKFINFADYNNDYLFTDDKTEILGDPIQINKGSNISAINVSSDCYSGGEVHNVQIVFKRPDSAALMSSNDYPGCNFSEVDITVSNADNTVGSGLIKVFASGRIQIN